MRLGSADEYRAWTRQKTWGRSREYLLAHTGLLAPAPHDVGRDGQAPCWSQLLACARDIGVDAAYGQLLAPWFMLVIPQDLTTRIAAAGESSPRMFELFREHLEIFPVLPHCKQLKDEAVETLWEQGAGMAEAVLLEMTTWSDRETSERALGHLSSYRQILPYPQFSLVADLVHGLHMLRFDGDEEGALRRLRPLLDCEDAPVQRLRAIAADLLGLAYKNATPDHRRELLVKALKWMNFALAVLPESLHGGEDWRAIKTNLGNTYSLLPSRDRTTNAETALRHLEDVLQVTPPDESESFAKLQDNLASKYALRSAGDRSENLRRAVELSTNAERLFATLGLLPERYKALINRSRSLMLLAPVYLRRKSFSEPEGLGAHFGILDEAEQALEEARKLAPSIQLSGAGIKISMDLAEVALMRQEILGENTLDVAARHLDAVVATAADHETIANAKYLFSKVTAHRLQLGATDKSQALTALEEAITLLRQAGRTAQEGECLLLATTISISGRSSVDDAELDHAESVLTDAVEKLAGGGSIVLVRHSLDALLRVLWSRYREAPAEIADRYRSACNVALRIRGAARGQRGLLMAHLSAGLLAVDEKFADAGLWNEAVAALTAASELVLERDQPSDWAQIQLALARTAARAADRAIPGAAPVVPPGDADLRRAQQIFDRASRAASASTGKADAEAAPVATDGQPESMLTETSADARDDDSENGKRPSFLLEFDYKRCDDIGQSIAVLDGVTVDVFRVSAN